MKRTRLFSLLIIFGLLTLMYIRSKNDNASGWISCINYVGLVIAVYGFLVEFSSRYKKNKTANFIKGLLVIVIVILTIVGCFIGTGSIILSTEANDQILLWTLLISLPTNYYCELLNNIVSKTSAKENTHGTK